MARLLDLPLDLPWRAVVDELPARVFAGWAQGMAAAWQATAVGGLVWTDRGLACIPRTGEPATWGELWVPGGKLATGETAMSGFIREVAEETGLRVSSARPREGILHTVRSGGDCLEYRFIIMTGKAVGESRPEVSFHPTLPAGLAFRADYLPYGEGP